MSQNFVIFCAVLVILNFCECNDDVPSKGEVWPQPRRRNYYDIYYTYDPAQFEFKVTNHSCKILKSAMLRYKTILYDLYSITVTHWKPNTTRDADSYQGYMKELELELRSPCEEYPYFEMDESYNISITSSSYAAVLSSDSIWGMLRGLETVSQMFYTTDDFSEIRINGTEIMDFPHYVHRGLLVDTARHFLPLPTLLRALDAMAYNKMNVLHWHIVDDQSFPYQSEKFPELSKKAAFHPTMVYNKSDIKKIVRHARDRAIRVVPEFDVPGHTKSWGKSHPSLMTKCYETIDNTVQANGLGSMHPLKKITYKILRDLFREVRKLFPDDYLHIGGDEVDFRCWKSNPELQKFMSAANITAAGLLGVFVHKVMHLLENKSIPILWQDAYFDGHAPRLPEDALIQVWNTEDVHKLTSLLADKVNIIYSAGWYLDQKNTIEQLLRSDPREKVRKYVDSDSTLQQIVGGEACLWTEITDENNIHSKIWPQASAIAEVLWSDTMGTMQKNTYSRLHEHNCRMSRRGIPTTPLAPGFCLK